MSSSKPTIYFGYGSNLWLHQMERRCPTSKYLGVARLNGYRWIINDRGYANVVQIEGKEKQEKRSDDDDSSGKYDDVVFGLVYSLQASDEERLDRNEGVPIAYTKEELEVDFWQGTKGAKVDVGGEPSEEGKKMLVYIDRKRVGVDEPMKEYIYRMNQGIRDAVRLGVPKAYVDDVMRKFIPDEGAEKGRKSMEEFAFRQADEFKDESGVIDGK